MITKDAITGYLLTLSKFCTKKGTDININSELRQAINTLTEDDSLVSIYVNNRDNFNLPDICVAHCYDKDFTQYLLNPDSPALCPFGYTIEIHGRCFEKYTDEELGALILHDILQNVMSDTAKIRFLKAYNVVATKHNNELVIDLFEKINHSEALYIAFMEICMRPFRAPARTGEYVSTDDVLKAVGLADAYDSYLEKALPITTLSIEDQMSREMANDVRDLNTLFDACLDDDLHHYFRMIRNGVPLLTLEYVLKPDMVAGFVMIPGRHTHTRRHYPNHKNDDDCAEKTLQESFNNPETEYEIRYQIDKIIGNMRYAETEAEREVILFKIKQLSIKLAKQEMKLQKISNPTKGITDRLMFIAARKEELDQLRERLVNMEIKKKCWSVYVKGDMPEGYDF